MRLLIRHSLGLLVLFFVCRILLQAYEPDPQLSLPKAILLSRLADDQPLPSHGFDRSTLLKVLQSESERFVYGESRAGHR